MVRVKMPVSWTSATERSWSSRSRATTILPSLSRTRVRQRESAASSATCSPWARDRLQRSTRLRFGAPSHPGTPRLLAGCVAGIGGYGNCFGVPTIGGEIAFDPSFDGNCLVNAFAAGIADRDKVFTSRASGVGRPVAYVGAGTGRDGVGGATMASTSFGSDVGGPSTRRAGRGPVYRETTV